MTANHPWVAYADQAWLAYLCGIQGHILAWTSSTTGTTLSVGRCERCGAQVRR